MKFSWPWQRPDKTPAYRIFSTEFDRTCTGHDLTSSLSQQERADWDEACALYAKEVETYRTKASILGVKWIDKLKTDAALQPRETAVSILIDHSGSLRGQRAILACFAIEIIADYLHRAGLVYEVLGFTTQSWRGGRSRRKWIWMGRRRNPGRLADLLHIVYRSAQDTAPGAPHSIRHLLRNSLLKENIDGEALFWAGQRLMDLGRKNNLILVISDGAPVDDSTLAANHPSILWDHLRAVIADLQQTPGYRLAGLGIDYDLSNLYPASIKIDHMGQLAESLLPFLTDQFVSPG